MNTDLKAHQSENLPDSPLSKLNTCLGVKTPWDDTIPK